MAWNGWAEDFVRRINYTPLAEITTLDNRNCLKYLASAGHGKYDTKYIFKTNFKENTQYTFIFDMFTNINVGNIAIEYTDGTTSEIRNLSTTAWNNVKMVSSPNKTIKYLRAQYSSGNSWIDLDTFMVYEGTEQIDFILHKEQTFTFPLGNEKLMLGDYLADDGIHHVRREVVLNGTETWWENTNYTTEQMLVASAILTGMKTGTTNIISSIAKYANPTVINSIRAMGGTIGIGLDKTQFPTVSSFTTWLSTHNTTVEYELEQEVIVPYTSAQQEVYNQIKQALSYEEQTNIRGSSNGSNPIFSVEAYQSTKLVLEEMATAIVALGGV